MSDYSPHLEKPLSATEAAELARLDSKAAIAEQLAKMADRLSIFYRTRYPRWAALDAILPLCYYDTWCIPVVCWPRRVRPWLWRLDWLRFILTPAEDMMRTELQARHRRPTELARLDHNPDGINGWIAQYERRKESEPRPDLHPLLAAEELERFETELPEKKTYLQRFSEDDPPAYLRHLDSLNKNAAAFREHIAKDLARFEQKEAPKLSLRQVAMFYYYTDQPLTDNNAADLAKKWKHTSKTSGQQLSKHYAQWCELLEGELTSSKRELGVLERDLAQVLPYLSGKAAERADKYSKEIHKKKKRGF